MTKKSGPGRKPKVASAPAEVLGHPVESAEAKRRYLSTDPADKDCPFTDSRCTKTRKGRDDILGTCSVLHDGKLIAICPNRFRERNLVLAEAAKLLTGGDSVEVCAEVPLGGGSADFIVAAVDGGDDQTDVVDFTVLEIQALDTNGSYANVVDVAMGHPEPVQVRSKGGGVNWRMSAKTLLSQVEHKLPACELMNRKLVLAIQYEFLEFLRSDFGANILHDAKSDDILHIHTYRIGPVVNGHRHLTVAKKFSTDVEGARALLSRPDSGKTGEELAQSVYDALATKRTSGRTVRLPRGNG